MRLYLQERPDYVLNNIGPCRPPEVLWGSEHYSEALDMWAVGCILGELLRHEPLFKGKTELAMVQAVC